MISKDLLATSLAALAYTLGIRWWYWRQRKPLTWHFAGNVAGALALVCFSGALLVDSGWPAYLLIGSAFVLIAVDGVSFYRARRRAGVS